MPYCTHCGNEVREGESSCPRCSTPLSTPADQSAPRQPSPPPPPTSLLAIASLVLGILGLFTQGSAALVGLILGLMACIRIKRSPRQVGGASMAVAGLAVSLLVTFIMARPWYSLFVEVEEGRGTSSCQVNTKLLAIALLEYTYDYDERLPFVYDSAAGLSWSDLIEPYAKGRHLRVMCPSSGRGRRANRLTLAESSELDYGINCEPYRRQFIDNGGTNECAPAVLGPPGPSSSQKSAIPYSMADVTHPDQHVLFADYGDAPRWASRDRHPQSRGGVAYRISLPDRAKPAAYACTCARQCDSWTDDGETEVWGSFRRIGGGVARFRHGGWPNVAFADGHVKSVPLSALWGDPGLWRIDRENP